MWDDPLKALPVSQVPTDGNTDVSLRLVIYAIYRPVSLINSQIHMKLRIPQGIRAANSG